jgi:serine/threonine protein kinase
LAAGEESLLNYLRILNVIGEGPRARVYLAEWLPPASGFAAVKRLTSAASCRIDDAWRQRLLALDHPHVAAVFDYGLDDQGYVYTVTEYVAGVPLPEWCRRQNVALPRRLELLIQTTSALEYAASRGVRHVNLKPPNILVARASGIVKLLDFDTMTSPRPAGIGAAASDAAVLAEISAVVAAVLGEAESSSLPSTRYESVRELSAELTCSLARHVA